MDRAYEGDATRRLALELGLPTRRAAQLQTPPAA